MLPAAGLRGVRRVPPRRNMPPALCSARAPCRRARHLATSRLRPGGPRGRLSRTNCRFPGRSLACHVGRWSL
eukprot:9950816-Lingulodinium_polyedra.AAC.1